MKWTERNESVVEWMERAIEENERTPESIVETEETQSDLFNEFS